MMRLPPNLKERFLKNIVRFRFLVHDAADQGAERTRISRIKLLQRLLPALRDFVH